MAIRIVGVDLPQEKRGEIALTYIYGIGRSSSAKILDKAGVSRDLKVNEWSDDQAAKIREIVTVFPYVVRAPRTMLVLVRVRRRLLLTRRRPRSKI